MNPIRVVVVDDEPSARRGIEVLLEGRGDVTLVGEAANVDDARATIDALEPDVVFLDVRMPGGSGLDAVRDVDALPVVVLVTAHEEHALDAFDVQAVDYLLKPFPDDAFERAMDRAHRQVARIRAERVRERVAELVSEAPGREQPRAPDRPQRSKSAGSPEEHGERIPVRYGERVVLVDPADVLWAEAKGDYVRLHTSDQGEEHLVRSTMQSLADQLGDRFARIHRSTLVRLDHVREIRPRGNGRYAVVLRDGERLNVSPGRYQEIRDRLGL